MSKVQICVDVSDEMLRAYEAEAKRLGTTPASLLEKTVTRLVREMEEQLGDTEDHLIFPS